MSRRMSALVKDAAANFYLNSKEVKKVIVHNEVKLHCQDVDIQSGLKSTTDEAGKL